MKHVLTAKGFLARDGRLLICPYSPVVMAQIGKVQGQVVPTRFECGLHCPLFHQDKVEGVDTVMLHCGSGSAMFPVEIEKGATSDKPVIV